MTRVIADISVSLDGFVTGPDAGPEQGLGRGGEPLHTWAMDAGDPVDVAVLQEATERSGAVIMGRRLFDIVDAPTGWRDEMGYGARHAATPAFFVVTHSPPEGVRLELDFTFVTEGLEAAVDKARPAAGERDVVIMGGADVIRQAVDAGLVEELRLHLAPMILGAGTPLFDNAQRRELRQTSVRASSNATHLTYEMVGR
jgi:dihydrofolate reductase